MEKAGSAQTCASILFGLSVTLAVGLSWMLLSAGVSFGFYGFDPFSLLGVLAIFLMALPLLGLAVRWLIPSVFDRARNRALLGLAIIAIIATYVAVMLQFSN